MSHMGAPWLTRGERMAEERPDLLWAALGLEDGDQACDIGSGNGYHTLPMAQAVAPGGRAFAVDIQVEMLQKLAARADAAVENITYVHRRAWGWHRTPATSPCWWTSTTSCRTPGACSGACARPSSPG